MSTILLMLVFGVPVPNFAPYPHFAPLPQFTPAAGTTPGLAHRLDLRRPPAIETPPAPVLPQPVAGEVAKPPGEGAGALTGEEAHAIDHRAYERYGWKWGAATCGMWWCSTHKGLEWMKLTPGEKPDQGEAMKQATPPEPQYRTEWRRGRWGRMYQVPIQERQRQPGGSVRSSSREGGADYSSAAVPFTDDPNEVPEKMLRANTRQHTAPKEPRHPAPHGEENPGTSPPHVQQQSGAVCPTCPRGG